VSFGRSLRDRVVGLAQNTSVFLARPPDMTGPVKVLPGRFFMRVSFSFFSFGR
jgi:hypothetical protein